MRQSAVEIDVYVTSHCVYMSYMKLCNILLNLTKLGLLVIALYIVSLLVTLKTAVRMRNRALTAVLIATVSL